MNVTWEHLLPRTKGSLPSGTPLRRTDPSGSFDARVLVLGAYPAATETRASVVGGTRMVLPTQVEAESFESSSKSGVEFDTHYLEPLGLRRDDVLVTDIVPYFLANTTKSKSGRSMSENISLFENETGRPTGIVTRPKPAELVELARMMPGNIERLQDYLGRCQPRLVLTLGAEAAAFVRGEAFRDVEARVDELFYAAPTAREVLGVRVDVVHLVHPHLFIKKNAKWMGRHRAWIRDIGRPLVRRAAASARQADPGSPDIQTAVARRGARIPRAGQREPLLTARLATHPSGISAAPVPSSHVTLQLPVAVDRTTPRYMSVIETALALTRRGARTSPRRLEHLNLEGRWVPSVLAEP